MREAELKDSKIDRRTQLLIYCFAVFALLSVGQGFFTSLKPGQSQDLETIRIWVSTWLWQGSNPYLLPQGLTANYPPHAITFLSPLALIPSGWVVVIWSLLNIAIAPVIGYVAFRVMNPDAPRRAAWLPCLLFLTWAGLRVGLGNGQFSLLMLGFGVFAVWTSERRPLLSGLFLALALMKPHVGGAFFLWALATRRWKPVFASLVVMILGLGLFSLRLGIDPVAASRSFLFVLLHQFGGPTYLPGVVELRPLVHSLIGNYVWAESVHLVVLLVLLGSIFLVAFAKKELSERTRDVGVLQLCCLWGLMGVFHNPYDMILLLPVAMGFWSGALFHQSPQKQWRERAVCWLLQLAMIVELPGVWWKISQRANFSSYKLAGALFSNFDRVLVLAVFIYILYQVRLSWMARHEFQTVEDIVPEPSAMNN